MGEVLKEIRLEKKGSSRNKFSNEYSFSHSHIGKIERCEIDCKFVMLWDIVEAMDVDFSEFIKRLKEKLGKNFTFIDE